MSRRRRGRRHETQFGLDSEHKLSLGVGTLFAVIALVPIEPVYTQLTFLARTDPIPTVSRLSLKGLFAGTITYFAYTTGQSSFNVGRSMMTKEKAFIILLSVMIVVGLTVDVFVPGLLSQIPRPSLQIFGLIFGIGIFYLHILIDDWRLENEWPHLLAALLVVGAPFVV